MGPCTVVNVLNIHRMLTHPFHSLYVGYDESSKQVYAHTPPDEHSASWLEEADIVIPRE